MQVVSIILFVTVAAALDLSLQGDRLGQTMEFRCLTTAHVVETALQPCLQPIVEGALGLDVQFTAEGVRVQFVCSVTRNLLVGAIVDDTSLQMGAIHITGHLIIVPLRNQQTETETMQQAFSRTGPSLFRFGHL